jgi:hypothetical protein
MDENRYQSFDEFWPFYVREHAKTFTRNMHFCGITLMLPIAIYAALNSLWVLVLLPVSGYGFAWTSHFFIEKNRPATFKYPYWSLLGDFKMFGLMCTGRIHNQMNQHIERES